MAWKTSFLIVAASIVFIAPVNAQDVPGIEICTVEKTMERRTSCLQSNVNFLQSSLTKQASASQQRLDAANRQIEELKATLIAVQKEVAELKKPKDPASQKSDKDKAEPAKK
jgi:hypothetical protein